MPKARITIDENWRDFRRDMDQGVDRGLGKAASVIVGAARATSSDYSIGTVRSTIRADRPESTRRGRSVTVEIGDWRGLLFERGTYQRKGRLRKGGDPAGPHRGVKPVRMLKKGMKVGFPRAVDAMRSEMGKWRA